MSSFVVVSYLKHLRTSLANAVAFPFFSLVTTPQLNVTSKIILPIGVKSMDYKNLYRKVVEVILFFQGILNKLRQFQKMLQIANLQRGKNYYTWDRLLSF